MEGAERRLLMPDRGILPGILDQPRSFATHARRLLLLACLAVPASAPSNASAATLDRIVPSVPTAVTAWAVGCHQINLAWNASTDTGGSGLGAYNVYVWQSPSWMFLKQVLAATTSGGCNTARYTTSNTGLTASTTYYYSVAAVDKAGNVSLQSTFVGAALPACVTATTVTTSTSTTLVSGDRTAPAMPTGVTAAAATCSQINLTWGASTDTGGSGLKGYNLYRNGVYLKQVLAPAISSSDGGLAASTVYSYAVKAVDNAGNASGMSATASSNTPGCPASGGAWPKRFGGAGVDYGHAVAADSRGNLVVAGYFQGTADFGGGPLTSAGGFDIFVAKYSPTGSYLWAKRYGGTGDDFGYGVAVDPSDNIVVTGFFRNTVNFGGGGLTSAGLNDIFIAKYAAADGSYIWGKRFGSTGGDFGYAVAVDHTCGGGSNDGTSCTSNATCTGGGTCGNVLFTGSFEGTVNFGGADMTSAAGGDNVFVAKYSAAGTHLWSETFSYNSSNQASAIAVGSGGEVVITGIFGGQINFGGATLTSAGGYDIFLAKLSGVNGAHVWSKRFGATTNYDTGNGVAVDHNGDVVLTGGIYGTVDFGGGSVNARSIDGYVAKFAGADGSYRWARLLAGDYTGGAGGQAIATDGSNNVVVTGQFSTSTAVGVDFGTGPLLSVGGYDVFLAKYAPSGTPLWSKRFGGTSDDLSFGVTCDASGNSALTGTFLGTADFAGGVLTSAGSTDIFVAKVGP